MAKQANASLNPRKEIWGCVESTTSKGGFLGALVFPWDRYNKQCSYPAWCPLAQHASVIRKPEKAQTPLKTCPS